MTAPQTDACAAAGDAKCIRRLSEREIALALVLEYAESNATSFSLMAFYDDDVAFLRGLSERLGVPMNVAFTNKLRRIVCRLVSHGVLYARMMGTGKEYIDEPAKQMNYFLKPGKAELIRRGKTDCTMAPEDEAAFLLRRAYPAPDA